MPTVTSQHMLQFFQYGRLSVATDKAKDRYVALFWDVDCFIIFSYIIKVTIYNERPLKGELILPV
jgi:hypothetical protein